MGVGLQERIRDGRPEYLRGARDASLRRLRLERIDLYQLHRHDPEVPVEESIGALDELRQEGKIRLIGVSNFSVAQLRQAQSVTKMGDGAERVQPRARRLARTSSTPARRTGAARAWSPLGHGLRDQEFELRWLLDRSPVMLPIPGTSSVAHLEANMRAVA